VGWRRSAMRRFHFSRQPYRSAWIRGCCS